MSELDNNIWPIQTCLNMQYKHTECFLRCIRGKMFEVLTDHLSELYKTAQRMNPYTDTKRLTSVQQKAICQLNDHVDVIPKTSAQEEATSQLSNFVDVRPMTPHSPAPAQSKRLPRVELIELLTDLSGEVRTKSGFTQYMNHCYKLTKSSRPVIIEVLPTSRDELHDDSDDDDSDY